MKSVSLEHVSVQFGSLSALSDVSLSVGAGEVLMLVGPNGAGKSSVLRVLLGLLRPDRGTLRLNREVAAVDNAFKRDIGYLPEAVAFAENLSGREVIRFFARARGVPMKRADAVLDRVGLTHAARRTVRGYSRGMRQRLGLGIAILASPSLLVLDEPTGGLDQEGLEVLWSVLKEWRSASRLVLLASHELTLLERRVDRICVMRNGRVLADATPAHLREQLAMPVLVAFSTRDDPEWQANLETRLRSAGGVCEVRIRGRSVEALAQPHELLQVIEVGRGSFGVTGVRVVEPGLDDVYQRVLQGGATWAG